MKEGECIGDPGVVEAMSPQEMLSKLLEHLIIASTLAHLNKEKLSKEDPELLASTLLEMGKNSVLCLEMVRRLLQLLSEKVEMREEFKAFDIEQLLKDSHPN